MEKETKIALHIPVIAVPKGNPKQIHSLKDLGNKGLRFCLGDPKAAAIGKTALDILTKNKLLETVKKNVVTETATVNEIVVFLCLRQVDAAIIWEDNALTAPNKIDIIPIPEPQNCVETISAGVTSWSKEKKEAKRFIRFWRSRAAGKILKQFGFKTLPPYASGGPPGALTQRAARGGAPCTPYMHGFGWSAMLGGDSPIVSLHTYFTYLYGGFVMWRAQVQDTT